jgi:O-Antigen ligase
MREVRGITARVNHPQAIPRRSIALYYYTATWDSTKAAHSTKFQIRPASSQPRPGSPLPAFFSATRRETRTGNVGQTADLLILSYVLLMVAMQFRNSSLTNVLRMTFVYTLSILVPYFAFSRIITTTTDMRKALVAFVLAAFPLCLVAVFEAAKGWLLYQSISFEWEEAHLVMGGYVQREGILRGTASAQAPIPLGFVLLVALGCLLALKQTVNRNTARLGFTLLGAGLLASLSRGPWIGAAVLMVLYLATGPNAVTKLAKFVAIGIICLALLHFTPFGSRLLDFLPFIGSVEAENVVYRQQLVTNSLIVAERHPWLGSVDYRSEPEMRDLIQGQGIVDVVNTYFGVVLEFGMVGLTLTLGFFASILLALRRALRSAPATDSELRNLLRASMATMVAILLTIGTVSSISYIPHVYWSFAGLCIALVRIAQAQRSAAVYQLSPSKVAA